MTLLDAAGTDPVPAAPAPGELCLVRHGETEWSRTGRHTSVGIPLTPVSERQARRWASCSPTSPALVLTARGGAPGAPPSWPAWPRSPCRRSPISPSGVRRYEDHHRRSGARRTDDLTATHRARNAGISGAGARVLAGSGLPCDRPLVARARNQPGAGRPLAQSAGSEVGFRARPASPACWARAHQRRSTGGSAQPRRSRPGLPSYPARDVPPPDTRRGPPGRISTYDDAVAATAPGPPRATTSRAAPPPTGHLSVLRTATGLAARLTAP